jgi:N-methylhydantoinase A/oxoprolinase/acetone carboxylase beta subunit
VRRIGVDVGGTNTDAVLLDGEAVRAWHKAPTTEDVSAGIVAAIDGVMTRGAAAPASIDCVMIGTTQFTNAFVERKRLVPVGIIRIGAPASIDVPPLFTWPAALAAAIGTQIHMVRGGYEYTGEEIAPLDERAIADAARVMKTQGIRAVAVCCIFSPLNDAMERRAAAIVRDTIPDALVTLSSQIGRIGLLERENAVIMNCALSEFSRATIRAYRAALDRLGIDAPFHISQNDGTLMSADYVEEHPVLTFASGPTNSMRGAAFLSGARDAMVADVGGTTTDIGVLLRGFPRESSVSAEIGGVRTNFRMPDVMSIALGGGTLVRDGEALVIGPESVGFRLTERALVFGGDTLTLTDIAVAAGRLDLGDRARVARLDRDLIRRTLDAIRIRLEEAVDRMKISREDVPLVLVGGGAPLVAAPLRGVSEIVTPPHAAVANAVGAAIAQVSGEVDRLFSYDDLGRARAMEIARVEAARDAVDAGADPASVEILDVEEMPLHYLAGGMVRLRVRAAGALARRAGAES